MIRAHDGYRIQRDFQVCGPIVPEDSLDNVVGMEGAIGFYTGAGNYELPAAGLGGVEPEGAEQAEILVSLEALR